MTTHIGAEKGEIAEKILLPGDPLRAKFIAENFLDDAKCFNEVRNMFGYTGKYKGKEVSVMGTGMGVASIGIYSYELINDFGVKDLIRIGSCGSYQEYIDINDIILVQGASTDSSYAKQFALDGSYSALSSFDLLVKARDIAESMNLSYYVGNILTSDVFYNNDVNMWKKWESLDILGVEMESYGLFTNASLLGARALSILTVSDSFYKENKLTAEEREKSLENMIDLALEI